MIDVHISFVVDDSSSMRGHEISTIEGFNQFLTEQQNQPGNAWMSLLLFGDRILPRYVAWNVKDIPNMRGPLVSSAWSLAEVEKSNIYVANGMCTMLYDAVGVAIKGAEQWQQNNSWFNGKMLVVIQTDGMENASRDWSQQAIKDLIEYKKGEGWEFLFLGTGEGSWLEAENFASVIGAVNTIAYDSSEHSHRNAYNTVAMAASGLRGGGDALEVDQSWNTANAVLEEEDTSIHGKINKRAAKKR